MKIVETREYFEFYRGEKELFPGKSLASSFNVDYVVLVPSRTSPADKDLLKVMDVNNLLQKMKFNCKYNVKTLFSICLRTKFPAVEFSPTLLYHILYEKPDLIIDIPYTTFTPRTYIVFLASYISSVPLLFINSGDLPKSKSLLRKLLVPFESYIYKQSYIISTNNIAKENLINEYLLDKDIIFVIPKCIDSMKFKPISNKTKSIKQKYVSENSSIVLYVGRIDKKKGIESLIYSAIHLNYLSFLVVGDGPDLCYFQEYCKLHHISNVKFFSYIHNEELPEIYGISDIVVLPDMTNPVGFSTVLSEAMSMGKAVIVGCKGFEDASPVDHMNTGIIIQPNSTEEIIKYINYLDNNLDIRNKLGSNARDYVEQNMDIKKVATEYYSVIQKLQEKKNGGK